MDTKDERKSIISAVKTPLGFFVLVVLIIEVILGLSLTGIPEQERVYITYALVGLLFLLIGIVSLMAVYKPGSLGLLPTTSDSPNNSAIKESSITNPYTPLVIAKTLSVGEFEREIQNKLDVMITHYRLDDEETSTIESNIPRSERKSKLKEIIKVLKASDIIPPEKWESLSYKDMIDYLHQHGCISSQVLAAFMEWEKNKSTQNGKRLLELLFSANNSMPDLSNAINEISSVLKNGDKKQDLVKYYQLCTKIFANINFGELYWDLQFKLGKFGEWPTEIVGGDKPVLGTTDDNDHFFRFVTEFIKDFSTENNINIDGQELIKQELQEWRKIFLNSLEKNNTLPMSYKPGYFVAQTFASIALQQKIIISLLWDNHFLDLDTKAQKQILYNSLVVMVILLNVKHNRNGNLASILLSGLALQTNLREI